MRSLPVVDNTADTEKSIAKGSPLGYAGVPDDIAPLAVLLSAPGSDYITGQVIAVDGGLSGIKLPATGSGA